MAQAVTVADPWIDRRRRSAELAERTPYAADLLGLFGRLCEVSSEAHQAALADPPDRPELPAFAAARVLPGVLEATLLSGPELLKEMALSTFHEGDPQAAIRAWLEGGELTPTERYLARASVGPVLEALPELAPRPKAGADARFCPGCGGLPQLSYFEVSGEALVTAPRRLLCSRCARSWTYPRLVCAGCGSAESPAQPIYASPDRFPGLRADCCENCKSYLITIESPKLPGAVPLADELTALPLDLYAGERGFRKIIPNLMGIG